MLDALKQELSAMKSNDRAVFEAAMDAKTRHIAHLEQQEKVFQPLLQQIIGSPCGKEQLAAYINNSKNAALQDAWQNLRTTLKQCYEQNLVNQRVLNASRAEVQQALNLLRGENQTSPIAGTYEESGKTHSSPSKGQSIGVV